MGRFYALDNFSAFCVGIWGYHFPTAEHAYQYAKYMPAEDQIASGDEDRLFRMRMAAKSIHGAPSAHEAKRLGASHPELIRGDWHDVKEDIMLAILLAKYEQHAYVQTTLERTGRLPVVETSPIDAFWGWGKYRTGRNTLGRSWMRVREAKLGVPIRDYRPGLWWRILQWRADRRSETEKRKGFARLRRS